MSGPVLVPARPGGARALRALLTAEARLFLREPGADFWIFVFPSLLVAILGLVPAFRERGEGAVKTRLTHVYAKLGVSDRAAAVAVGYDRGILGPGGTDRSAG
ncbi:hypothetical protein [Streptomyces sp. NPDC007088]|uniref:hypothetical protein n=1 Tax=Streptomyces sp. NPDC007088 TaxID=3364773 RepID=UPI0036945B11